MDEDLVKETFKFAQVKTKKELINLALKEFVENKKPLNLLDLESKIEFSPRYNRKRLRESR